MLKIIKRSGKEEEFSRTKITNSMLNAGISKMTAESVSAGILCHDGLTTAEVRNKVIGGIKNREPQAAKQYESRTKKIHKD